MFLEFEFVVEWILSFLRDKVLSYIHFVNISLPKSIYTHRERYVSVSVSVSVTHTKNRINMIFVCVCQYISLLNIYACVLSVELRIVCVERVSMQRQVLLKKLPQLHFNCNQDALIVKSRDFVYI
jgi:hypothetical protein